MLGSYNFTFVGVVTEEFQLADLRHPWYTTSDGNEFALTNINAPHSVFFFDFVGGGCVVHGAKRSYLEAPGPIKQHREPRVLLIDVITTEPVYPLIP